MTLAILYRDENLIAINKPSHLLVHRSSIDKYETQFAVQLLREQLGQRVYPIHRLDKPTSGVLLFALNNEMTKIMSEQWQQVEKIYWAVTRGKVENTHIDHPITTKPDKGDNFTQPKVQAAQTEIKVLASTLLKVGFGKQSEKYPTTYFSLVQAKPRTGRKHQIRKHLKHINHPIVGDTRYGRGEINRYFRQHYDIHRLLLHCQSLSFYHPISHQQIIIEAALDETWKTAMQLFQSVDYCGTE